MKLFFIKHWVILIIFILAFILRFWKIPELFYFGIDEEYHSLLALSQIKDFHPIWIGLSAGKTGYYIGPGLIYLHALLLWVSRLDPVILGYTASTISMLTIITLYFISKKLFSEKIALIATALYSFLPFILLYDRRFWNPTLTPLITIILFYGFIKLFQNARWHLFIAFLLGISFHIHASLLIFVPVYMLLLIYQYYKFRKINFKLVTAALLIFLLLYSPLIVYDLVHNFDNLKTPLRILQGGGESTMTFNNYYLIGFMPLLAILVGKFLNKLNNRLLFFLLIFYVLNAFNFVLNWKTDQGLATKKDLITKVSAEIGRKSFRLETTQTYLHFGGWRYLFEAYGKKPQSSQADEMFGWIYPTETSSSKTDSSVVISVNEGRYKTDRHNKIIKSGIYTAIIKNE